MGMSEVHFCEHGWASNHRAAVSITRRDESRGGVLVQQRDRRRLDMLDCGQHAVRIAAVGGITDHRVCCGPDIEVTLILTA